MSNEFLTLVGVVVLLIAIFWVPWPSPRDLLEMYCHECASRTESRISEYRFQHPDYEDLIEVSVGDVPHLVFDHGKGRLGREIRELLPTYDMAFTFDREKKSVHIRATRNVTLRHAQALTSCTHAIEECAVQEIWTPRRIHRYDCDEVVERFFELAGDNIQEALTALNEHLAHRALRAQVDSGKLVAIHRDGATTTL